MKILIAEDDNLSRASISNILKEIGHNVADCRNGCEALKILNESGDFDLIISDIKMPETGGIELLKKVKETHHKNCPEVILFTGFGDMNSAIDAIRCGAYDYILKPINIEELIKAIERLEERNTLRSENEKLSRKITVAEKLTEETKEEMQLLKSAYCHAIGLDQIGVFSNTFKKILAEAQKLHTDRSIPVLIEGDTGTGKEVIARYIHYGKGELTAPFIDINCAAISPSVFESELFGYEAGSFTGGLSKGQKGKFDIASGGTLFLDEIAEMPIDLQAKLLRVIQEKEFYRIGGLKKIKTDVRIICATNLNIEEKVKEQKFRQDLYFRLNVGRVFLPSLKDRPEEILPLARLFLKNFSASKNKNFTGISSDAEKMLVSYNWPGNIRELKNIIERIVLMSDEKILGVEHLEILLKNARGESQSLSEKPMRDVIIDIKDFRLPENGLDLERLNKEIIKKALELNAGNKSDTANYLGISRRSLYCKLKHIS
ncbi:MAG TPA: sigma-54 dependent transcriptional regulator [Candidatus Wallbacteria bacterium]|nr:sigma-54 dependent transcriptional regulator [Candidatus Wallbacteria bacterium]